MMKNKILHFFIPLSFFILFGSFISVNNKKYQNNTSNLSNQQLTNCVKGVAHKITSHYSPFSYNIKISNQEKNSEISKNKKFKVKISWFGTSKHWVEGYITVDESSCCNAKFRLTNQSFNINKSKILKNLGCVNYNTEVLRSIGVGRPFKRKKKYNRS